jgi:hypothetical protein
MGSRDGVGIGSKIGVSIGCSVKFSVGSGVGVGFDLGNGVGVANPSAGGFLCLKGVEAASCARTRGAAARKTITIANRRMVFFRLSPWENWPERS